MSSNQALPVIKRKLIGVLEIDFKLINKTGLLIRSPLAKASIGGTDTEPMITKKQYVLSSNDKKQLEIEVEVPYIPGSSLKGRMRSLLELHEGAELYFDGKIYMHVRNLSPKKQGCKDLEHALDNLFGMPSVQLAELKRSNIELAREIASKTAPTRLIIEDIFPSKEYIENLYNSKKVISKEDFFEEKSENRIDRITSAADPRFIVRVKPDIEFQGRIKILLFDVDMKNDKNMKIQEYLNLLFAGMKLIEDTYLGGSGTRGYGKVEFKDIKITLKTPGYYLGKQKPIEIKKLSSPKDYGVVREDIINEIMNALREQK